MQTPTAIAAAAGSSPRARNHSASVAFGDTEQGLGAAGGAGPHQPGPAAAVPRPSKRSRHDLWGSTLEEGPRGLSSLSPWIFNASNAILGAASSVELQVIGNFAAPNLLTRHRLSHI